MSVLRTQLAGAARKPARFLLTGLAVLVASFVVFATFLAYQITTNTLLKSLSDTSAVTDVVVKPETSGEYRPITPAIVAKIRQVPGVGELAGRRSAYLLTSPQGGGDGFSVDGDPGAGALSAVKLTSGTYPAAPGEVAATARTVQRMGLKVGSTTTVFTQPQSETDKPKPVTLKVTGVVESAHDFGENMYTLDANLAPLVQGDGGYERVDIVAGAGASSAELVTAVQQTIDASGAKGVTARPAAEVRDEEARQAASGVGALFALIGMFVAIAVVAAGLVSASTFRIVFAQRMRQLALLRAVGAPRGALVRALVVEGGLVGLVAGLAGVLVAFAVGTAAPLIARAFGLAVQGPGLTVSTAIAAVLVLIEAVVITLVSVLSPAWRAAKVAPLEALRSAATTAGGRTIGSVRAVVGVLLAIGAAGGAVLIATQLPGHNPKDYSPEPMLLGIVLSGTLAYGALMALGPVLFRPVLAVVGWPLRRLGPVGRLAVGGVGGAPRRAAAVAVVVALGVTLMAGVLVGNASLQVLMDREIAIAAPADMELTVADGGENTGGLPAGTVEKLRARGELKDITPYRTVSLKGPDGEGKQASDLDISKLPPLAKLDAMSGSLARIGPGEVVLARDAADTYHATTGDTVTVSASNGGQRASLRVVATLPDDAPLHVAMLMNPTDLTTLGASAATTGVLANVAKDGEDARTSAITAVRTVTRSGRLDVLADKRDDIEKGVAAVVGIALGLIGLTVVIAVVGVGTTTALSVVERIRESGLLRAVGLSRIGLRTMLTTEAGLYGAVGAVMGVLLGVPYAWLSVLALGIDAPVSLPAGQLALVMVILAALTALAGLLPARRAAKVSPVAALGSDE